MKSILKRLIGQKSATTIRRWFPSEVQKKAEFQETARKVAFYATFVENGSLCFDVGANIGNRITPLLKIGARIIAIEPQQKCIKYLKRKFGKMITIVEKGLGESECVKEFHLSEDSTLSSFSDYWIKTVTNTSRFKGKNWIKNVKVSMTTLDELIKKYGKPSFIKIDVEGYELEVLKGLTHPIKMISFEYTVPEQPERAIVCIDQIEKYNKLVECNYSIGEDLVWALPHWVSAEKMRQIILSPEFLTTSFGDIYVRTKEDAK